jgi:pristinamycin I synthase 3 and 4
MAWSDTTRSSLTIAQRSIWFAQALDPSSPLYNIGEYLDIDGRIDVTLFEAALRSVVLRTDSLHLRFIEVDGEPRQYREAESDWTLAVIDVSHEADPQTAAELWMYRDMRQAEDLAQGPLFQYALFRVTADRYLWYARYHHLSMDGFSVALLVRRVAQAYSYLVEGRQPEQQPFGSWSDLLATEEIYRQSSHFELDREYWLRQLAERPEPATLCGKLPTHPIRFLRSRGAIPRHVAASIKNLPGHALSAVALSLYRFTGTRDLVIGMGLTGRIGKPTRLACGMMSKVLPLRLTLAPEDRLQDLFALTYKRIQQMVRHQRYSVEDLRRDLGVRPNDPGLYGTTLNVVSFDYSVRFAGCAAMVRNVGNWREDDLQIAIYDHRLNGDLQMELYANADHYTPQSLEAHRDRFLSLFEELALESADTKLYKVSLVDAATRDQHLQQFNPVPRALPHGTIPEFFEQQAARSPEAVALVNAGGQVSYGELDAQANGLAWLLKEHGVRPGSLVAVRLERGPDFVTALLAILKAGAAYIPLDPAYPSHRVQAMIAATQPHLLITGSNLPTERNLCETEVLLLDRVSITPATVSPHVPHGIDSLAYVMFTSGSTGEPKGSAIPQSAIIRLVRNTDYVILGPGDRMAQVSNASFDAATFEIWGALLNGATLFILPRDVVLSPEKLADALHEERITTMFLTSALFNQVAQESPAAFSEMRDLLVGGDTVDPRSVQAVFTAGAPKRFLNGYGPTENTTFSTWHQVDQVSPSTTAIPIGRAIDNSRAYVLDSGLEPIPAGVTGELYVAGAGLAWGYWNKPALSAERFVADPYGQPGTRMYRTGDLARWTEAGAIECLGRVDRQAKIRGYRIELGEIEATLRTHPLVKGALVKVDGTGSQKHLLAYAIARESGDGQAQTAFVEHWRELYESTYGTREEDRGNFDITGWMSSYTGRPIPSQEMAIWVEETVERLRRLKPTRIAEIGCGTGLLATRLAESCERYIGLDFSSQALARLSAYAASRSDLASLELHAGEAHHLTFLEDHSVDLVILNSVVQYFPDVSYLLKVLSEAARVTRPGGHIFVGDIRNLLLLDAFHASVQMDQAEEDTAVSDLKHRVLKAKLDEQELILSPAFFEELAKHADKIGRAEINLKRGAYDNELSRFRYDVLLQIGEKKHIAEPAEWLTWDERGEWRSRLESALAQRPGEAAGIRGIPDRRVSSSVIAARVLHDTATKNAGELKPLCVSAGEDPDQLMRLAESLEVEFQWRSFSAEGVYDGIFAPQWKKNDKDLHESRSDYKQFANEPASTAANATLSQELMRHLKTSLPEYMIPVAVTVLPAWPLNPNGKVDLKALPVAGRAQRLDEAYQAPQSKISRLLARQWETVLGIDRVGEHDDFFALGGHSLMATQVMSRVRDTFGVELTVRALFDAPKLTDLAQAVEEAMRGRPLSKAALTAQTRPNLIPASWPQQRLWFIDRMEGGSPQYNVPEALRLRGELDREALEHTINQILDRHESLRTCFVEVDGTPMQVILPPKWTELRMEDLSHLDPSEKRRALKDALRREWVEPFDLKNGPLFRARLLKLADREHILLRTCHHIVSDGWSMSVFNQEFEAFYQGFLEGRTNVMKPLPVQYADFALWQRSVLTEETLAPGLAYWKKQLAGMPARLELPMDRPREVHDEHLAGVCITHLEKPAFLRLKMLAEENGATLYMTLLAALGILLERYTGQDDFVVGTPVANRQESQLERMIGFFVNSLPIRLKIQPGHSFQNLLAEIRTTTLAAYQHQDVPFERLVEELAPERVRNIPPIFQITFSMMNAPIRERRLAGLIVEPVTGTELRVRFDLEVYAVEEDGQLKIYWMYNRGLFERARMKAMSRHFETLLSDITERPKVPLRTLRILSPREKARVLGNNGRTSTFSVDTLSGLVAAQAARTPHATALVFQDEEVTYAELNTRANRIAHRLIAQAIGPESIVGIRMAPSIDMIVTALAVLKTGAAYLPLDPQYPETRLTYMISDARPSLVLTSDSPESQDGTDSPVHDPAIAIHPSVPAYIIYTSGSTGKPKGVVVTHGNITRLFSATNHWFEFGPEDTWTLFHSFSFDFSVWEIWGPLTTGGKLVIVPRAITRSPEEFVALLKERKVTVLNQTPSAFRRLSPEQCKGSSLRLVLFGGEALNPAWLESWFGVYGDKVSFVNMYGITETTVHVTYECVTAEMSRMTNRSPIGVNIPDLRVYVLDSFLEPAPPGVTGELYVAGAGLARGYLNQPKVTAERFLPDIYTHKPGERMYRSGDLARWSPNGSLEYAGRADTQVKIRGFRIEAGEIEAALMDCEDVAQASVITRTDANGEEQLAAYIVPDRSLSALTRVLHLEQSGELKPNDCYELSGGLTVKCRNHSEAEFLYREIFEEQTYLKHGITLPEAGCVFDVGANIGMFTTFVSQRSPATKIYAFEPIPPLFDDLRTNAAIHSTVMPKVFNCGLSSQYGTSEFVWYKYNSVMSGRFSDSYSDKQTLGVYLRNEMAHLAVSSAALEELTQNRMESERFLCELRTISEIIAEEKIETIDLLKVDVEKSEWDVLQGISAEDWPKIQQVVVEVHDMDGRLERIAKTLKIAGFIVQVEQDIALRGTALHSIYARRPEYAAPAASARNISTQGSRQLIEKTRQHLQRILPDYMMPGSFTLLTTLPLTTNGKLDVSALPKPQIASAVYRAPRTSVEATLCQIYSQVLGVEKVGIDDSFFALGGHSLNAARVSSRLRAALGVDMPIRLLFETPAVASLAERLPQRTETRVPLLRRRPAQIHSGTPAVLGEGQ